MSRVSSSSSSSSSRMPDSSTATAMVSLVTFSLVSLVATQLERWKRQHAREQGKNQHRLQSQRLQHPSHPPERLVQYLHTHGGKQWRDKYTVETEEFVRVCPKVELHVHLDGSLDPDFLWHCLKQYDDSNDENEWIACLPVSTTLPWDVQHPLPLRRLVDKCQTEDDFHELCTCRRGQRSLQNMLTCFEIFLPLVRSAPPALLLVEELAYDFCKRQWEQNVVYTEVRHCPHLLMSDNEAVSGSFDMDPASEDNQTDEQHLLLKQKQLARLESARGVLQAITRGLQRGCKDYKIVVNQILCAINWRSDWAWDILALAQEFGAATTKTNTNVVGSGVVGIDIAAGEEHFDKEKFPHLHQAHFDMMQQAQALGIPITMHAGETPNGIDNVRRSVAPSHQNGYGARRIGHGYRMVDSVELMQQLASDKIHVEICPTSSVETGGWMFEKSLLGDSPSDPHPSLPPEHSSKERKPWKDHPGLTMIKHGVPISLNSDDPAVFHTSLSWQYRIALTKMGLTRQQVMQTNLHAIEAAFGRKEDIEATRKELQSFMDRMAKGESLDGKTTGDRFTDRVRDPF